MIVNYNKYDLMYKYPSLSLFYAGCSCEASSHVNRDTSCFGANTNCDGNIFI